MIFLIYIFIIMAVTYGINFPFMDSNVGDYLKMTPTPEKEIRANLIHLLLTRKGSRYYLPDFGTRLYEYIFEQNDAVSYNNIQQEIRDAVKKYIPNLEINSITVTDAETDQSTPTTSGINEDNRLFRVSTTSDLPYTANVRIDYTVNNNAFSTTDFVIINI